MTEQRIVQLQALRAATGQIAGNKQQTKKTIAAVEQECRRYIRDRVDEYKNKHGREKLETIRRIIVTFVMENNMFLVDGYIDDMGRLNTSKLIEELTNIITNYDILTDAMRDPDVFEIRGNGKFIKIEKNGKILDYLDDRGKIIQFSTVEQQEIIMRKLLGDVRMTPKDALVNAITIEGYRLAAVHKSATAVDPLDPNSDRYHSFVLRKFKESRMKLPDIIKSQTISDDMGRLLSLFPSGDVAWWTVGPTASGKTTTNNAILQEVYQTPNLRVCLVQNPTEITLWNRDKNGRVTNDVLHLEAADVENATNTSNTMENVMAHILRLSPDTVVFGEMRRPGEFAAGLRVAQMGHPSNATFHANSVYGAFDRAVTAYLAYSGNEPPELAYKNFAEAEDAVIVQKILKDGTRRVLAVAEVLGVNPDNPFEVKLNLLYDYEFTGEVEYDSNNHITKIHGYHRRVGQLHPEGRLATKFRESGIQDSRYDFLLKPVDKDEKQTYTGENISEYGKPRLESRESLYA